VERERESEREREREREKEREREIEALIMYPYRCVAGHSLIAVVVASNCKLHVC
jgi:hypothetical protein